MVNRIAYALVLVAALGVAGEVRAESSAGCEKDAFDQTHVAWTAILSHYTRAGIVDYAGLKQRGAGELGRYLASLAAVCREHYRSWPRPQKLAFWINAYNAYTIKLILDHYPLKSIRNIGVLPLAGFRQSFIPMQRLLGKKVSLNHIENEILRKELRETRIHFAIVCASKSCPALRAEAYRGNALGRQLDAAARGFVRDGQKNRYDAAAKTLFLSAILEWFRKDFEQSAGSVLAFVARYADPQVAEAIRSGSVKVKQLDYDWSLNGK